MQGGGWSQDRGAEFIHRTGQLSGAGSGWSVGRKWAAGEAPVLREARGLPGLSVWGPRGQCSRQGPAPAVRWVAVRPRTAGPVPADPPGLGSEPHQLSPGLCYESSRHCLGTAATGQGTQLQTPSGQFSKHTSKWGLPPGDGAWHGVAQGPKSTPKSTPSHRPLHSTPWPPQV